MLYFYYGTEGVTAFKYDNTVYHYKKDMLGNILGIYDGNGQLLVKYSYDAWGNHKTFALQNNLWVDISGRTAYTTSDNTATKLAILNPFRYRSYYFDIETGLYYLQSRYYDPETGRFISMDDISYLDPESIHGLNLYAYCGNNPVMCIDPSGCFPIFTTIVLGLGLLIGAVVGGKVAYDNAVSEGKSGSDLFWETIKGGFIGATFGVAAAGLLMAAGAAIYSGVVCTIKGISIAGLMIFGMKAKSIIAIGLLAFDLFALVIAPLLGIEVEAIGWIEKEQKAPNPPEGRDLPMWQKDGYKSYMKNISYLFK